MHRIQCHSWNSNGKAANVETFLADLIKAETKHSSDEDFNYTFVITTSFTQIAKECIVKAEPFTEIPPDENMELSDPISLQPENNLLSQCEDFDPNRTICPVCGKVKSSKNMRRHMKVIHKVDIDPEFQASLKARMKVRKLQISNDEEPFDQFAGSRITNDPLNAANFVSSQENHTNVELDEISRSDLITPQKTNTNPELNSLKCHLCNKVLKSSLARHMRTVHTRKKVSDLVPPVGVLKPTHDRCPICERFITANNLSRHFSLVHSKTKSEIKEMRLNIRYTCLICKALVPKRYIKKHFIEAHNIYDDIEVKQGVGGTETTDQRNDDVKSETVLIESVHPPSEPPEPGETSEIDNPMDQFYAQCTLCSKTILRISLKRHFQSKHNLDETQILKHLLLIANQKGHAPSFLSKCTICNFSGTLQGLNVHYTKEHSTEMDLPQQIRQYESQCPLCKRIMNRNNLKRHLHQKHALNGSELLLNLKLSKQNRPETKLTISECSLCGYKSSTDALQRLHYKRNHSMEHSTNADNPAVALIHHQVRSGYTCTLCLKVFTTRPIIMEHFRDTHSKDIIELSEDRFDCDLCSQEFTSFDDFDKHQHEHIFKSSNGQFLCNYCGQYKQSKAALESHIGGHLNLRNFSCDICHKRFNEKRQIMSHMISHTNEKPFICTAEGCTAAFPRLAKLREHLLLHTTDKRYDCEICGKKFMLKRYLR